MKQIQFGIDTFGELAYVENTDELMSYEDSLKLVIEEGILADKLGIDVIALGEHHREEYAISSPDTVLAALSQVTENIILGTGVTVLSSDDPVRVYERFATLDAISNGRAQVMVGRGSFIESFPLFGYDLKNYNELFEEKLKMFNELLKQEVMNWQGEFTQSLNNIQVYPIIKNKLDVHVGVGGSPDSIIRTAKYGFPLMLAIIGGEHKRFKPYIELYEKAMKQYGHTPHPVGIHSHGVIADTDKEAIDIAWEYFRKTHEIHGRELGLSPMTYERFLDEVKHGAYFVGSPETVAQKLARVIIEMGIGRFDLIYSMGGQYRSHRLKTIQLYGEVVIPRVRELLNEA